MMAGNSRNKYEIVTADDNLPGKVTLYEKPGKECFTNKHWHKNLEIDYIIRGRMWTSQNGVDKDIYDNDFVLINSEVVHQTCGKEPDEPVKYLVVLFSYSYIKSYFPSFDRYTYDLQQNDQARTRIRELLKGIVFEVENPSELSTLRISCAMGQILILLFSKCKVRKAQETDDLDPSDPRYINRAVDFIKENYKEKISLDDISSYVGLTPTYFSRYFKNNMHRTFKSYLNLVRLEGALNDIENFSASETKAALQNGFPSVKSFIAVFKSVYGCAPSEYVKLYNEQPPISQIPK